LSKHGLLWPIKTFLCCTKTWKMVCDGGKCMRRSVNKMLHRKDMRDSQASFGWGVMIIEASTHQLLCMNRWHFDQGPSITVVLVMTDNGELNSQFGLSLDYATLMHSAHHTGKEQVSYNHHHHIFLPALMYDRSSHQKTTRRVLDTDAFTECLHMTVTSTSSRDAP
jgi:hypothetical protein